MGEELDHLDEERISEIIWKYVGVKSVREIARLTGLKPEEVLRRKNEMLDGVDVLSVQQKRQKFLIELDGMARDARERAESIPDEFFAGTLNAATGAIKAVLAELARMEKQDKSRIDELNQKRVRELVSLVREVVDVSVGEIAERFGLDVEELYEIFNRRMIEAAERRDLG